MASNRSSVGVRQGARSVEEAGQETEVSFPRTSAAKDDLKFDTQIEAELYRQPSMEEPGREESLDYISMLPQPYRPATTGHIAAFKGPFEDIGRSNYWKRRRPSLKVSSVAKDDLKFDREIEADIYSHGQPSTDELSSKEISLVSDGWKGTRQPDYGPATSMVPELYRSATIGDIAAFKGASEDKERSPFDQVSPRGNTVLHLAAILGLDQLVELILPQCPDLVKRINNNGDLALHVAASGGHLSTVKSLVQRLAVSTSRNREVGETEVNNLLKQVNNEGNTALHVALENHHQVVAKFLVEADPTVSHYRNREEKSPLCMAAQAGYLELVKLMMVKKPVGGDINPYEKLEGKSIMHPLEFCSLMPDERVRRDNPDELVRSDNPDESLQGKSLLHAAITGRNRDILDTIWSNDPTLIKSIDKEGRTPLSLAAYIGYLDGVRYLLEQSTDGTYLRNRNGRFPIHVASSKGHIKIVQEFLKRCPDSRELINQKGRNILHEAAKCGKAKMVSYMLETRELEMLINERDNRGYTPLHLATKHWQPKVVSILTWDKRVSLNLLNNDGLTAMDVAEKNMKTMAPFREQLTLTALQSASAQRSERKSTIRANANAPRSERKSTIRANPKSLSSLQPSNKEQYKDRVNTLLLVSTLVATVTFAAGFTMPGGNNDSSGVDEGMATFITKRAFQAFLICNMVAMYSSIIVAVDLIFAQLGDLNLILT